MATDTADLMGKVYDLLSSVYAAASSNKAFLAFESMGVGLSDAMFKLPPSPGYCAPVAVERLSKIADVVPVIHNGFVASGSNTIEAVTATMLEASMPINADAMPSVGQAKLEAGKKFDQTLGSTEGIPGYTFRPVFATPVDWFDSTSKDNWTLHTVGQQQATGQPPPPRVTPMPPPVWRVLPIPLRATVDRPIGLGHPMPEVFVADPPRPVAGAQPLSGRPVAMMLSRAMPMVRNVDVPEAVAPAPPTARLIRPVEAVLATKALAANTTTQAVASSSVSVEFEHCVVTLTREWLPENLMLLRNWYLPGYAQGQISGGLGASDTGLMPVLPTGFVVIRNLKISAKWSEADLAAAEGSAAFGPFSLMGRTYDAASGTLSCPGMQIIGWFCSALSVLPPQSDPALPKAAPAMSAPSTVAVPSPAIAVTA